MPRVLLVEDDPSLGLTLAERLERESLIVSWVQTAAGALAELTVGIWDLAIVDVMLPDGSGFAVAREIKARTHARLMFMTALNSAENRLQGFEIGADAYLPKPFHLKEFIIRVRQMVSRQRPAKVIQCGGTVVDLSALVVRRADGERTFLQVRDSRVLELLADASHKTVSRAEILDHVWGEDQFPSARSVDNAIVRLRHALGDEAGDFIQTIHGVGYQWRGEVKS